MSGSGWAYSWRACLWGLLVLLTLGLAMPWRESALERYKMRHLHYGDLPARFEGSGSDLFKRTWWLWLLSLPIITLPFTYPAYKAAIWRWWVSGVRFGEVHFESELRTGSLMGLYWAVIGWTMLVVFADIIVISIVSTVAILSGATPGANAMLLLLRQHPIWCLAPIWRIILCWCYALASSCESISCVVCGSASSIPPPFIISTVPRGCGCRAQWQAR
jgi:uncharacterized membrane protein YjgN (DUF898 family)